MDTLVCTHFHTSSWSLSCFTSMLQLSSLAYKKCTHLHISMSYFIVMTSLVCFNWLHLHTSIDFTYIHQLTSLVYVHKMTSLARFNWLHLYTSIVLTCMCPYIDFIAYIHWLHLYTLIVFTCMWPYIGFTCIHQILSSSGNIICIHYLLYLDWLSCITLIV